MNVNMFSAFQQFMSNPQKFVMSQMGIPEEFAGDPNKAIQHLMNTGRINQAQYNAARMQAPQIQNSPMFQNYFKQK